MRNLFSLASSTPWPLDLYLTPPGGGLLDFDAAPLLVDKAYHYTRERLPELEESALVSLTAGAAMGC